MRGRGPFSLLTLVIAGGLFVVFAATAYVAVNSGMSGGDAEGIAAILFVLGGGAVAFWVTILRRYVRVVPFSLLLMLALPIIGYALGTISSGEEVEGATTGAILGIGIAIFMPLIMGTERAMAPKPSVFLCYRRDDTAYVAGRIKEVLERDATIREVFFDIDNVGGGAHIASTIKESLAHSKAVVVLIGRRWIESGNHGATRLDSEDDYLRQEIEYALQNRIPLVPVLVDGARMPVAASLPDPLRDLAELNALAVRPDPEFHADVGRVAQELRGLVRQQ